eukprot:TRINITY_DN3455_c0_g2_i2.p1 TRINITY_DN3455_c0_g2~~TRINITY_DN3455_c0_g2_i2.p1  ORF type:complete len:209 (+),score=33.84 TRINITY_DN3455_c0_g2_i2:60-629(+)
MCIRDRSTWGIKIVMKVASLVALCLLLVGAAASLSGSPSFTPAQAFIKGVSLGLKKEISDQGISRINDRSLSKRDLDDAIDTLNNPSRRRAGVSDFYELLLKFFQVSDHHLYSESAFINLKVKSSKVFTADFNFRELYFKRHNNVNIAEVIQKATKLKNTGDYLNAGVEFGYIISNLYYVPIPGEFSIP